MVVTPALYKTTTSCKQVTTPLFFYLFGLVVKLVLNLVWVFSPKERLPTCCSGLIQSIKNKHAKPPPKKKPRTMQHNTGWYNTIWNSCFTSEGSWLRDHVRGNLTEIRVKLSTHPCVHIHTYTHIHTHTHTHTHTRTHTHTHTHTLTYMHKLNHLLVHSFTYSLIHSVRVILLLWFTYFHWFMSFFQCQWGHSLVHWFTHSHTCWLACSLSLTWPLWFTLNDQQISSWKFCRLLSLFQWRSC